MWWEIKAESGFPEQISQWPSPVTNRQADFRLGAQESMGSQTMASGWGSPHLPGVLYQPGVFLLSCVADSSNIHLPTYRNEMGSTTSRFSWLKKSTKRNNRIVNRLPFLVMHQLLNNYKKKSVFWKLLKNQIQKLSNRLFRNRVPSNTPLPHICTQWRKCDLLEYVTIAAFNGLQSWAPANPEAATEILSLTTRATRS